MLHFDIVVYQQRVVVNELTRELSKYDVSVDVDGDIWRYRIKKATGEKLPRGWRERGFQQAHYHAKNSGEHVVFKQVTRSQYVARRKLHPNQMKLF